MAGATSLVQLILKKFGDDAEGAAKELVRMGGFPESVANRIATGELPMDEASRVARREAQSTPTNLFHGSTHDIKEFNGRGNPANDWGEGTYLTDSTHDASRNYAGTHGADFQSRLESTKDGLDIDDLEEFFGVKEVDEDRLTEMALKSLQGENSGVIYPVRVKQNGLLNVNDEVDLPDYNRMAAEDLGYDPDKIGRYPEEIEYEIDERRWEMQAEDYDSPNSTMFSVGNDYGGDMSRVSQIEEGDTWERVRENLGDTTFWRQTEDGDYMGAGSVLAEVMRRGGAKGVVDDAAPQRFPTMEAGQHTVIFPGSENQIRSVNAAFDPEYTGPNIMGNATVPMLGATALGTAGLLAAPALMKDGVFQHGATSEPVVERKEPVRNQSSLLESVTDFGDEVIKSAKHAAGPLSLLVPYEGVNNYLKTVNDEDRQPTWWDRLGLLDF